MTPRPQTVTDAEVFAAAARVLARGGPAPLMLADIATETGLTAGRLVQRFGSKRGLLLAIAARGPEATRETFARLRGAHESPLAALRAYAQWFAQRGGAPGALAHPLGSLQLDLTDREFHQHAVALARATRAGLRELLDASMAAGELAPTVDLRALARTIHVVLSGSLTTWTVYRTGTAARWVRDDLEAVLRPLTATSDRGGAPKPAAGARAGGRSPVSRGRHKR
jgi:AcrR family transcriptional regulator